MSSQSLAVMFFRPLHQIFASGAPIALYNFVRPALSFRGYFDSGGIAWGSITSTPNFMQAFARAITSSSPIVAPASILAMMIKSLSSLSRASRAAPILPRNSSLERTSTRLWATLASLRCFWSLIYIPAAPALITSCTVR